MTWNMEKIQYSIYIPLNCYIFVPLCITRMCIYAWNHSSCMEQMSSWRNQDLRTCVITLQLHMSKINGKGIVFCSVPSFFLQLLQLVLLYDVYHVYELYHIVHLCCRRVEIMLVLTGRKWDILESRNSGAAHWITYGFVVIQTQFQFFPQCLKPVFNWFLGCLNFLLFGTLFVFVLILSLIRCANAGFSLVFTLFLW